MRAKKFLAMVIALGLAVGMTAMPTLAADKKTFVFGDTTFNAENEEADINPQNTYAGWACIRYGVGETLFRYSDAMEIEPWIAKEYENIDELTWKITLNDGVVFSNGRACDGEAVKESLEALVANHERAAGDLCIDTIEADGNTVTIKTTEPKPALINYLSDPYGCIIDMQAGVSDDGIVIGTGPYVATELVTDDHVNLVKNENYWNGDVNVDEITVRTISDGDTLAMALQAGEINAAYGMAYASYPLFENDDFTFTSTATSRAFYAWMNFESPVTSDPAVRKANDTAGIRLPRSLSDRYGAAGAGVYGIAPVRPAHDRPAVRTVPHFADRPEGYISADLRSADPPVSARKASAACCRTAASESALHRGYCGGGRL